MKGQRKDGHTQVQVGLKSSRCAPAALLAALATAGCGGGSGATVGTPVSWWHDLQGGAIAANRPPPPGADQPYPHLGTIPAKPKVPSTAFRKTVEQRLAEQRDATQRLAARTPITVGPAQPAPGAPATAPAQTEAASATLPGAEAAPAAPTQPAAAGASPAASPATGLGPAADMPLTIAGTPLTESGSPPIPDAPPPPPTFENVAAQPAPTPLPPLPAHLAATDGTVILFSPGGAVLDSSQAGFVKDAAEHRGRNGTIEVEGHGDSQSDAPGAQAQALSLAVKRAQAVAAELITVHVPQDHIHLAATAFGRDALIRVMSQ